MTLQTGDRVGERFEIERLAGSGGMGEVYRARDLLAGGAVAIKALQPGSVSEMARFEREARVLADLSHPAIVRYVAHGVTRRRAWDASGRSEPSRTCSTSALRSRARARCS